MKLPLQCLFGAIFLWMVILTIRTSLQISLWAAWSQFADNPWAIATLWDAYFGFLTFYVWVLYKEPRPLARILWFVLIMGLGNIAMALYVLIQLARLQPGDELATLLLRRPA